MSETESLLEIKSNLPHTFEKSDALERLAEFDTTVGSATVENIRNSLRGRKVKIRSAEGLASNAVNLEKTNGSHNVVSTKEDPAVIFIYGASFCSLNLMIDRDGNTVGIHQPMLPVDNDTQTIETMKGRIDKYVSGGKGIIGEDSLLLLSGVNINTNETHERDLLVKLIEENELRKKLFPTQRTTTLFIKAKESHYTDVTPKQRFMRRLTETLGNLRDFIVGGSHINNTTRDVSGIIFIPKQLDGEGVNRVLLIDRETDRQAVAEEVFDLAK